MLASGSQEDTALLIACQKLIIKTFFSPINSKSWKTLKH